MNFGEFKKNIDVSLKWAETQTSYCAAPFLPAA